MDRPVVEHRVEHRKIAQVHVRQQRFEFGLHRRRRFQIRGNEAVESEPARQVSGCTLFFDILLRLIL